MFKSLITLTAAALLAGCASMNQISSDVSSFGDWPAERKPGTYAFERLPSQQAQPQVQQSLEAAAKRAVEAVGFTPAADAGSADFLVQLGVRVNADERWAYPDPFWWRGSVYYGRRRGGGYWGPGWGAGYGAGYGFAGNPTYEREVALLIRDRKSGRTLYETHASNDGNSPAIVALLPALFEAAMKDFPAAGINPRRVVTEISPPSSAP